MPLILGANSVSGGYNVANSLRFNAGSSDYLNRTPSSTTDRQKATLSFWTKYCDDTSGNIGRLFNFGLYPNGTLIYFGDGAYKGKLLIDSYVSTSATVGLVTTQLFRDYSAWYHIVVAFDTTQATASNRVKLYVNGTQVTTFDASVYPSQNENLFFNFSSSTYQIGKNHQPAYFSGYLAETYMIDGQQLDPTYFGETDFDSGIWKPIPYTGSFGTNGFYLQFKNSGSLGLDSSGNANNFTVNNLTSIDQTTDTCTNNFATANPLVPSDSITYSNGNLTLTGSNSTNYSISNTPTFGVSKGKWYWEIKYTTANANQNSCIGVVNYDNYEYNQNITSGTRGYISLRFDGSIQINGVDTASYFIAPSAGDILMGAMDMDNGKVYFGNNGTWFNSGNPATSTNPASSILTSGTWTPVVRYLASVFEWNFGNPPFTISSGNADAEGFGNFEYAVPSGYFALCSKNLAEYA